MTIVAGSAAVDVGRVFSGCRQAVVAGTAGSQNLGVIDNDNRRPQACCMAVFADVRRTNVCQIFASRVRTVMAADTVAGDIDVIEVRRCPGDSGMTVVTGCATAYVSRMLTGRRDAIVAGIAGSQNVRVIDAKHRLKNVCVVAILTDITGLDVGQVLADCIATVVATEAGAGDVHMVEVRR